MLLYYLAVFCFASATAFSVFDVSSVFSVNQGNELRWAESYSVKATKIYLFTDIEEDITAWKTEKSSRVDYDHGAVKMISNLHAKYQIHPETTEKVLNEIVCYQLNTSISDEYDYLQEILPSCEGYAEVGNENVGEKYATKFESTEHNETDVLKTIWAAYDYTKGWIPLKYDMKEYDGETGSLLEHIIWNFFDYDSTFADEDVFDISTYGCNKARTIISSIDHEKITKDLLFIDPDNKKHTEHVFNHFMKKYNRNYAHEEEHALRKSTFKMNLRMIASVNRRNMTYKLAVNKFSDWTPEQIGHLRGKLPRDGSRMKQTLSQVTDDHKLELVKNYDMRLDGVISSVKDQGECGSCWAFAATAAVESALAKRSGGKVLSLSSQALVDCAYKDIGTRSGGCDGGIDAQAYEYIMKHGLPTEEEYGPYKGLGSLCSMGTNINKTYFISEYEEIEPEKFCAEKIKNMKVALLKHGPLYVSIHTTAEFRMYSNGVFQMSKENCDPTKLDHSGVLIGYGEKNGELYWIFKNSFGESWGMDGYMLIDAKDNTCGIATEVSYPVFS